MTAPARDVREGERWTGAQRWKNALVYAMARIAIAALRPLPPRALRVVGRAAGVVAYALFGGARRIAIANAARAMPDRTASARGRIVRRAYRHLGAHLGDAVAALHGARAAPIRFAPGAEARLRGAIDEGRGVVFASAHLGPWERVAASLVAHGVPLITIAREAYDPRFSALFDRLRGGGGFRVIYRGVPGAAARIVRALRGGAVLGAPMDLRSRVASIDVPFLGVLAPTARGPGAIALRTGAAVVVGTVAPGAGGEPFAIDVARIETGDLDPRDARAAGVLTARINAEISARILALPEEWVWMHPRYAGAPRAA